MVVWIGFYVCVYLLSKVEGKTAPTHINNIAEQSFEELSGFPREKDTRENTGHKKEDEDRKSQRKGKQSDLDIETNTVLEPHDSFINETNLNVRVASISVSEEAMDMASEDTSLEKNTASSSTNFISSLLAEGSPDLVKVLLDNSKPENLEVFLQNSNITIEELQDFVHS